MSSSGIANDCARACAGACLVERLRGRVPAAVQVVMQEFHVQEEKVPEAELVLR